LLLKAILKFGDKDWFLVHEYFQQQEKSFLRSNEQLRMNEKPHQKTPN